MVYAIICHHFVNFSYYKITFESKCKKYRHFGHFLACFMDPNPRLKHIWHQNAKNLVE